MTFGGIFFVSLLTACGTRMLGPIFTRECLTLPRRGQHYVLRALYLGVLWVLSLTVWQVTVGWRHPATLGDTANFSILLFQILTNVQLILLLFFSALSAASSVAQEKDRRTFALLLMTDLRNYEIVLGKLVGSLLQIGLFVAGTVPVLFFLVLLGGIDPQQVFQSMLVLFTTAIAAGSLGSLIAVWRDKTFQALALTVLFLVLYLCLARGLGLLILAGELAGWSSYVPPETILEWQSWLEPFMALDRVLSWTSGDINATAYYFTGVMIGVSLLLNTIAITRLRRWNPSGEPVMQREMPTGLAAADERTDEERARAHAAPGTARPVWENPILWREMRTYAYGRRPFLVKTSYFIVVALIAWYTLSTPNLGNARAAWGLVPIAILSLVLVSAQAVTSITSERDLGALDLLLVTDLSPREFIFGKLWGIVYNTKEFLLPPILLAGYFAFQGWLATPPLLGKNLETFFFLTLGAIILLAFAMVLGIHVALCNDSSRKAIINTLGTVFFLTVGTMVCMYLIRINGRFEYQWLSFAGFIFAGVAGLWWVMGSARPSTALNLASTLCPIAVFYSVTNVMIGKPGVQESTDPLMPFLVTGGAFAFAITAMLVPLLSEFDVALGHMAGGGE